MRPIGSGAVANTTYAKIDNPRREVHSHMTLEFPIVATIKSLFGWAKRKELVAAPALSTFVFDSRDAAIFCLSVALILSALAVIFLAARRQDWSVGA